MRGLLLFLRMRTSERANGRSSPSSGAAGTVSPAFGKGESSATVIGDFTTLFCQVGEVALRSKRLTDQGLRRRTERIRPIADGPQPHEEVPQVGSR